MRLAKTILRNTLFNWIGMVVGMVVLFFITPYILEHLGKERYGIYRTVFSITQYLIIMELGMRGAVSRFASKYIYSHDSKSLNQIVSTTFYICVCVGILVIAASYILGLYATRFFDIREIYQWQTLILFVGLGLTIWASFLSCGFGGILIGHNRYDLLNLGTIVNVVGRATLVVVVFSLGWISLSSWALVMVICSFLGLLYLLTTAYYLQPDLSIRIRSVNTATVKELYGFGLWAILIQLSGFINISVNNVVIAKFLGMKMVPFYAIPFLLADGLRQLSAGLANTLVPVAARSLVTKDKGLLRGLMIRGTQGTSLIVFSLGGMLLIMCRSLLTLWVGPEYGWSWIVYAILMVGFFGSATQAANYCILMGGGNIRGMSIAALICALANIPLSIYFVKVLGWGVQGAALGLTIPTVVLSYIFLPWYTSRQAEIGWFSYLIRSYTKPLICVLPSLGLAWVIVNWFAPKNLYMWCGEFFLFLIPFAILVWFIFLDSSERQRAKDWVLTRCR